MTAKPLRVGIVGGNAERAWAKDAHVPALKTLTGFVIDAVSARTQPLADQAAAAFGARRAFGDSIALVRDPDIDVVAVTVKVPEHRPIVLAALEAGKHLYCEWPLGRDVAEAEEMTAAAANAKGHVLIGCQALFAPAIRHAAEVIRGGVIGRPISVRVLSPTAAWGAKAFPHYAYLQDKRDGATLATIAGGHTMAAIQALVGEYDEIDARTQILHKRVQIEGSGEMVERTCYDHLLLLGHHESGCVSSLEVIGGQASMPFRLELTGSAGSLLVTVRRGTLGGFQVNNIECEVRPKDKGTVVPAIPLAVAPQLQGPPANVADGYAWLESDIRSGKRTTPDFGLALRLTRLLDAIDVAADSCRRQARASGGLWSAAVSA